MKKIIKQIILLALVVAFLSSCKKESPATTDTITPVITLQISGGGFSKTFNSDEILQMGEILYKPQTKYNYTIVMSDTGGLQTLRFRISSMGATNLTVNSTPLCTEYTSPSGDHAYQYNETNMSNPYKSYVISGDFVTPFVQASNEPLNFTLEGRDFRPNRTNLYINGDVTDNPAGGYGWVTF